MITLPAVGPRKTPLAALVLVAVLAPACGGGGPSQEEFAEKGNAICKRANRASPSLDGSSTRALRRTVNRLTAASRRQAGEIRELDAPEGRQDELEALAATFDKRTELLERVRAATRSEGSAGFNDALRANARAGRSTNEEADRLARELGLDECLQTTPGG